MMGWARLVPCLLQLVLACMDNTSCFDACIPHGTHETCHGIFCDQMWDSCHCHGARRTDGACDVALSTPCTATHDVLLNAATMATAELNAEHLAAGTSRALDAVIHVATAAALQEERQAVGVHNVRIITDAPGLADHGSEGANLLHFDIAFGLCAPQAALEAAESEKRQFERVLGQVAAQRYEAFKISTIRLLELEPRFQTEASSTSQYQVAPLPQEEEPPDLWAEIWWLPWLGCIMVLLAGVCTFFFFRMRRRHLAECNFDGAVSSRQVDAESPEWKWKSYVVRVACSFDGRELKGTALDLLEGDLVQVEAEVDNAWLYGHTARDFDLVGFIPKSYVEELGTGLGAKPLPPQPISPPLVPPPKGLLVTLPSKQAERASVMEIFAASRGWLYGRHVGSSATSWFPENSLVEAPASGPSGPRYAAHGTASWTCGDRAGAPECDAPPDRPKARRSFSRQMTDAIASALCTGAWPKS